jgi:hypothetical protein
MHNRRRILAAWVSYALFLAAALAGAVAILIPMEHRFGAHRVSGWGELVTAVGAPVIILCIAVYLGDIVWLILARFVFSYREASMVVRFGPTSRFDRWLLDTIVPRDDSGAGE